MRPSHSFATNKKVGNKIEMPRAGKGDGSQRRREKERSCELPGDVHSSMPWQCLSLWDDGAGLARNISD